MKKNTIPVLCLLITLCGCSVFGPAVPTTKFSARIAGQKFEWSNPKQTTMTNIVLEVSTNGTARMQIGAIASANDPGVINNSYAGQAVLVGAIADGFAKATQAGAAAAGAAVGAAAKAP